MISLLLAVGIALSPQDQIVTPQFRARVILPEGHQIYDIRAGFALVQGGRNLGPEPVQWLSADGEVFNSLTDYQGMAAYLPIYTPKKALAPDEQGYSVLMADGTIRNVIGVPIVGGGEVVAKSVSGQIFHPETGQEWRWNGETWVTGAVHLLTESTFHIRENGELTDLELPEAYSLSDYSQFRVIHADQDRIVARISSMVWNESADGEKASGMAIYTRTFIWRDGEVELLATPGESVMNIDGRETLVTNWWAEIHTLDGRLIGLTECRNAEKGKQSKYFVTEWKNGVAKVLPIPQLMIDLSGSATATTDEPDVELVPFEVLNAEAGTLSADRYGNIGLSPLSGIGIGSAYLWNGARWINVTEQLGMPWTIYRFQLAPEGRKAFLYGRVQQSVSASFRFSSTSRSHSPLWLVEY